MAGNIVKAAAVVILAAVLLLSAAVLFDGQESKGTYIKYGEHGSRAAPLPVLETTAMDLEDSYVLLGAYVDVASGSVPSSLYLNADDAGGRSYHVNVRTGGIVHIYNTDDGAVQCSVVGVTSGYGLSVGSGGLTGTMTRAGTVTVTIERCFVHIDETDTILCTITGMSVSGSGSVTISSVGSPHGLSVTSGSLTGTTSSEGDIIVTVNYGSSVATRVIHVLNNGSPASPLSSLSVSAEDADGRTFYVALGAPVSITCTGTPGTPSDSYGMNSVTPGFGLSYSSFNITGTAAKEGTAVASGTYYCYDNSTSPIICDIVVLNNGTPTSPLASLSMDAEKACGRIMYVKCGTAVSITHLTLNGKPFQVGECDTGFGLSVSGGDLSGTLSAVGVCRVTCVPELGLDPVVTSDGGEPSYPSVAYPYGGDGYAYDNRVLYIVSIGELTLSPVTTKYVVQGKTVTFAPSCSSDPSGASPTYSYSGTTNGLKVSVNNSTKKVTCTAPSGEITTGGGVKTCTFTLTASSGSYLSDSESVTVKVKNALEFRNGVSAGSLGA